MNFYWDNGETNMLHISDADSWHLYAGSDDGEGYILLERNGKIHIIAGDLELYCESGRIRLQPEDVMDIYREIIARVYVLCMRCIEDLNFEDLKRETIIDLWQKWYSEGRVPVKDPYERSKEYM